MKKNPIRATSFCITQRGNKMPRKLQKKHRENCGTLGPPLQLALQDLQALPGCPLCKDLVLQVSFSLDHRRTALAQCPENTFLHPQKTCYNCHQQAFGAGNADQGACPLLLWIRHRNSSGASSPPGEHPASLFAYM